MYVKTIEWNSPNYRNDPASSVYYFGILYFGECVGNNVLRFIASENDNSNTFIRIELTLVITK